MSSSFGPNKLGETAEEANSSGGDGIQPPQPAPQASSSTASSPSPSSNEQTGGAAGGGGGPDRFFESAFHPNNRRRTLSEVSDAICVCKQDIEDKEKLLKSAVRSEDYAQAASLKSEIALANAKLEHLIALEKEVNIAEKEAKLASVLNASATFPTPDELADEARSFAQLRLDKMNDNSKLLYSHSHLIVGEVLKHAAKRGVDFVSISTDESTNGLRVLFLDKDAGGLNFSHLVFSEKYENMLLKCINSLQTIAKHLNNLNAAYELCRSKGKVDESFVCENLSQIFPPKRNDSINSNSFLQEQQFNSVPTYEMPDINNNPFYNCFNLDEINKKLALYTRYLAVIKSFGISEESVKSFASVFNSEELYMSFLHTLLGKGYRIAKFNNDEESLVFSLYSKFSEEVKNDLSPTQLRSILMTKTLITHPCGVEGFTTTDKKGEMLSSGVVQLRSSNRAMYSQYTNLPHRGRSGIGGFGANPGANKNIGQREVVVKFHDISILEKELAGLTLLKCFPDLDALPTAAGNNSFFTAIEISAQSAYDYTNVTTDFSKIFIFPRVSSL